MSRAAEEDPAAASLPGRIDQACDAFEQAWKRGESPRLEEYLRDFPEAALGRAFNELLELELAYRHRAGQSLPAADYLRRFPAQAGATDALFERTIAQRPAAETVSPDQAPPTLTLPLPRPNRVAEVPRIPPPRSAGTPTSQGTRFQVLRSHAQGGLGEVLVAEDRELRREVAFKQIQPAYADDAEARSRFILEAEITGRLEHPGIVPVYGLGTDAQGRPFYAMRFIRGESLKGAIETFHADRRNRRHPSENRLQLRKLLGRFIDVCDAIEFAHSRGILHRDLKPANVMLGKYGETLVVDWGLAKVIGEPDSSYSSGDRPHKPCSFSESAPTQMGVVVGTPQFMSPEQASGLVDQVGPRTDVYGLGATLYCLLTGRPPLAGEALEVHDLLQRIREGQIPPPRQFNSEIPKSLEAVCSKAMAVKPDDRYASARALAEDIEHWLADEPIAALPDGFAASAARWVRRHRAWAYAIAAALLVIRAVATVAVVLVDRQRQIADQLADSNGRLAAAERAARAESDASFRQARDAVDDLFTKVSEDTLLNQPGMQSVRKDLLQKTLDYYQRFLAQRGNDPAVEEELAATEFRVGRIVDELQSPDRALPYLQKAAAIQERLLAQSPRDPKRLQALGDTENALGRALHRSQHLGEASQAYAKARELRQQLVDLAPRDKEYRRALANTVMNVGLVEDNSGHLDAAGHQLQVAQLLRQSLLDDGGDSPKLQRDMAMGFYNQGLLELKRRSPDEARKYLGQAIGRFQELAKQDPRDLSLQFSLATCYRKLGDLESVEGPHDEAAKSYELARDGFERLADRNPEVAEYQAARAGVYMNLAGLQEPATALATFGKAQGVLDKLLEKYPQNPQFRRDLAAVLRSAAVLQHAAGQVEPARKNLRASIDSLKKLVAEFPDNPDFAEQLALSRTAWEKVFGDSATPPAL